MRGDLLRAVRAALARPRPLSGHPDANLLTAFAENTLVKRERAAVAGHLADCAECREFLALAFGAEPAGVREVRRWPMVLSWAASVATICIVVSAVWEVRTPPLAPPPGPLAISAPQPRQFVPPPMAVRRAVPKQRKALPPQPPAVDALSVVPRQQAPAPQFNQQAEAVRPGARYLAQEQAPLAPAPMPAASRFSALARTAAVSGPRVLWAVTGGVVQRSSDGQTWEPVPIDDQVSFRAVTPFGADVWAGGAEGALFHSTDWGAHWKRVATDATGTIVAIRAAVGGEAVATTDDGRTWQIRDTPR